MRTSEIKRTSHRGEGRVIAENVYEGHIVSETQGKKRLIGVHELESVIKEERVTEGETRVVKEVEMERRR